MRRYQAKIVFTTGNIVRGGKERQLFLLTHLLAKKGYTVNILTLKYSENNYIDEYNINKEQLIHINKISVKDKYNEFKRTLKQLKPDLVMSWEMQTALYSLLLFKKLGFSFINGSIQHGIRLFKPTHLLRSFILFFSPCRLANSYAGLKVNNLSVHSKKNFVLCNGIEDKFKPKYTGPELEERRREIIPNYIQDSKVYISVANLVPYKDYFTVLKALSELRENGNFHYLILGEGPLRNQIESEISRLGLEENVHLAGRVSNVVSYLRVGDIFIHSSKGEGISNAILEAMFCGLPVVSTNVGGVSETVFMPYARLYPYKNVTALKEILNSTSQLKGLVDINNKAYLLHLSRFSKEKMLEDFELIVSKVLGNYENL